MDLEALAAASLLVDRTGPVLTVTLDRSRRAQRADPDHVEGPRGGGGAGRRRGAGRGPARQRAQLLGRPGPGDARPHRDRRRRGDRRRACWPAPTRRCRPPSTTTSAASPGCATLSSSRSPRSRARDRCGLPARAQLRPAGRGRRRRFCMKESALGLVPDLTGTKPLVECVGYARALEICATARTVEADEAQRIGLVAAVVPAEQLDATVADLVGALTAPMAGAVRRDQGPAAGRGGPLAGRPAAAGARGAGPPVPRGGPPASRAARRPDVRDVRRRPWRGATCGPTAAWSTTGSRPRTVRRILGFARPHRS